MDRQERSLLRCGVAVAALLTLAPAAGAVRVAAVPPLSGDAAGLRLVRQVNRSYATVPAVRLEGAGGGLSARFTLVMRNGVVVAEQALVDEGLPELTLLVRREHQETVAHDPDRDCWTFIPKSDPQALTDVGKSLLSGPGRVSRPRVGATTVTVTITMQGQTLRAVIDKRTMHLRRFEATGYVARFTNLTKAPALPTTQPRC